jgi:hypothetical protein
MVHSGDFSAHVEYNFAAGTAASQRESRAGTFRVASSRIRPSLAGPCGVRASVVELSGGSEGSFFCSEAVVVRTSGTADFPDPGAVESAGAEATVGCTVSSES